MSKHGARVEERFWSHVDRRDDGECWEWTGATFTAGYGALRAQVGGKRVTLAVHRLSWQLHNKEIPAGLHVLHRCDNRRCVNPAHLFLGSNRENVDDKAAKGRTTHGERNHGAKLTAPQVAFIRAQLRDGIRPQILALHYAVTTRTIYSIGSRATWRSVVE